jgi:precorrin-2 dehydrogenase/sirohydrochlorin ferrochelatase
MDYPVNLRLAGRLVVVVGGGRVAARKVPPLLEAGARLRLVAPAMEAELASLGTDRAVELRRRPYASDDLDGAWFVIAATGDETCNRRVAADCEARGLWVNVVDVPELCTVTLPAVVRRGALTLAASTGGASPALAARLRRELEERYGPAWAEATTLLRELRAAAKARLPDPGHRRRALAWLATDAFLETALNEGPEAARRAFRARLETLESGDDSCA